MDDIRLTKISKFLSKHLRHQPERIGLALQPGGWVAVDDLLRACAAWGHPIDRATLDEVVERNDKRRFAFDETGTRLRAQQGHSVAVDLELEAVAPPAVLYHGTGRGSVTPILRDGLKRMRRHHVHLSADRETALRVGGRHGGPVVFAVDAQAMRDEGWTFYRSGNGVWLVDDVPARFLQRIDA